ncbi:hypothetical protein M407DRAFT_214307 [Tulasnella calospora MUT 4182]|uniref:F-box domain-containing protein n=1 Tax=Tulasnella calospora MUT 4182 TaxID=1051891 RepID=A0A0C3QJC8_9AGAM|nr:hypothetical protein M407DRAFT_214307 [Tulasnella calospora MUT 4182]
MFEDYFSVGYGRNKAITTELISALVDLHPRGALCPPRLRMMIWTCRRAELALAVVPFLCDSLEELYINLNVGVEDERRLIKQAAGRTPHLKSLGLDLTAGVESSLGMWLSKSQLLESLSLPQNYQTAAIVQALDSLTYLKWLKLRYASHLEGRADQCFPFNSPATFPRLETLEIGAPLDRLAQLFQTSEQVKQLKEVILSSDNPTSEQVFNLTTVVAQRCRGINSIALKLYPSGADQDCSLSFEHIRPLLACHGLQVFEIETRKPFPLNEQDLKDMALAWPGIQQLDLSPNPYTESNRGGFPLRLLPIAAGLLPTLRILGIYLDPEGDVPEPDYKLLPSSEFQSLQVLDFGTSIVPAEGPVALGFIIGPLCKQEVQITVREFRHSSMMGCDDGSQWATVQDIVTALVKSKRAMHEDWTVIPKPRIARF